MSEEQRADISKDIQEELQELQDAQESLLEEQKKGGLARTIGLVSVISIALGGFNADSFDGLEKDVRLWPSQMTDIPSHRKARENIYIRSSSWSFDQTFMHQYIYKTFKQWWCDLAYQDDNFIPFKIIIRDNAIVAYLVFPDEVVLYLKHKNIQVVQRFLTSL